MSVSYKDYYAILGISKSATKQEIAKAFKSLARKYHPDMNKGDATAEEKFKEINEAYEVLKDDEKRKRYDTLGSNWQAGPDFSSRGSESSHFSDFFEAIFGSGFQQHAGFGGFSSNFHHPNDFDTFTREQNLDTTLELEVTLEEVAKGANKPISLRDHSTGAIKNLEITIPQGIQNNGTIRLKQQGKVGRNGTKGDLYLNIIYKKHPYFTVQGKDVYYTLHIPPWIAVLGGHFPIPTLYGNVELSIPKGSQSGTKLRMQGKGLGNNEQKGSMVVVVQPDAIPSTPITKEQEEAWKVLQKLYER